jgi:predicted PurR-regulated permease PerM
MTNEKDGTSEPFIKINTDKLKKRDIAILALIGIALYFLSNLLSNVLQSRLNENPNLLVLVILVVIVGIFAIILYSIKKVSDKP